MNCALCHTPIHNYNPAFHHLKIDEQHTADICESCGDKFVKWQAAKLSKLFPTRRMKKIFGEDK